ncbi:oligosaccharide flippase family protein [Clostridium uliginosum]|uniref:Membrane protein involved in the export of O-antigen and teichoic acid n=1 Tax=Clostridium uliginosum TaxID=119641 RepID=A0A1I1MQS7_9CLOT|nr:oligosaccharide flippase family protein [Clostridium uliginosum]SFC85518.1 Membrane protein involved in the export of O-antigen and teichoic acid [Clostridium uliginosum]
MAKSMSKNAFFKAMLNLFNIILPILVGPVITRVFGPDLYGYIGYGESLTAYFLIFASFGIYQYGLREVSRVRDDKVKLKQTFTSLFIFTTVTNIVTSAAYMIFVSIVYKNQPYFYTCIILGFNLVSNLFYVEWVNEALENYDFIAIKTMIVRIIYSALIVLCVRNQKDFLFYLYLVVFFNLLNNIISFIYIKKRINFDFNNLHFARHIKPMFFVVILSNTGVLYTQLDKIMIGNYIGLTDVGYYCTAQKIMTIINTLMLTVIQVTMPRLSNYLGNGSKDEYMILLKRIVKIYFMFLFPASIGVLCLSREVILIYGGIKFIEAVPIMIMFSIYMLSIGVEGIIANQIIYLHGREKDDVKLIFIGGILNLIFNSILIFIGKFSATNAIATTLLANLIVIGFEYRLVKKNMKIDINLFSFENIKYFYYSLLFIPLTLIVKYFTNSVIMVTLAVVFLCGIYYVGILAVTKDKVFFQLLDVFLKKLKIKKS